MKREKSLIIIIIQARSKGSKELESKMLMMNLSESKATDLIQKTDKRRASYYNYYSIRSGNEAKRKKLTLKMDSGELKDIWFY